MSTRIEGTNVLIRREDISANFPGGVDAFTGSLDSASIRWKMSDETGDDVTQMAERTLSLGVNDGFETVLDLQTGTQTSTALIPRESGDTPVHDALIAACDAIGWRYHGSEPPGVFVDLPGKTGRYSTKFYAGESDKTLVSIAFAPLIVPLRARRRVLEFIARANYRMLMGGFEFSLDTGALVFKTSQDVGDQAVTDRCVYGMAWNGVMALDRYTTQLMEVIYAKRNIREAVAEAERL